MYDPFAYGIAIAVVELPYLLVQAMLFVPVAYWMIAFQASAAKFFYYLLMFLATITFYTIFGQFLVYVTPSMQLAQVWQAWQYMVLCMPSCQAHMCTSRLCMCAMCAMYCSGWTSATYTRCM
jgi:ABC-type multidrug transport system permease subunit